MIVVRIVGSFKNTQETAIQDICEALAGWEPFVNDEFTISNPEECPDGRWVTTITIGDAESKELVLVLNMDTMFLERNDARELIHTLWTIGG